MSNIGTTIGAIVGIFIALLVGLSLFNEVADQTADVATGGGGTEGYAVGDYGFRFSDGTTECTYPLGVEPYISVTGVTSEGGISTVAGPLLAVPGVDVACPGSGTTSHEVYLTEYPSDVGAIRVSPAATIGEGATLTIMTSTSQLSLAPASIDTAGGIREVPRDLSKFIALEVILNILPTVVLVGLLSAGGVLGGFIGRSAGGRFA